MLEYQILHYNQVLQDLQVYRKYFYNNNYNSSNNRAHKQPRKLHQLHKRAVNTLYVNLFFFNFNHSITDLKSGMRVKLTIFSFHLHWSTTWVIQPISVIKDMLSEIEEQFMLIIMRKFQFQIQCDSCLISSSVSALKRIVSNFIFTLFNFFLQISYGPSGSMYVVGQNSQQTQSDEQTAPS